MDLFSTQKVIQGDCLEVMKSMEPSSIDCIVTDPPYGLSFMGKDWDHGIPGVAFWKEALRVCKPGAMMLAFGGDRTHHHLMNAIENAGWEIKTCLYWITGQGFPKSHNFGCKCKGGAVQYTHDEVSLSSSKKLQGLQSGISLPQSLSGGTKQSMQQELCERKPEEIDDRATDPLRSEGTDDSNMSCMSKEIPSMELPSQKSKNARVFEEVQRKGEVEKPNQIQQQRKREKETRNGNVDGKEPSMERRGDLQEEQRELHRPEICKVSNGIPGDGSEGRLHNGASTSHGQAFQQDASKNGSSSSQRSQHQEQFDSESGVIQDQQGSQERRGSTCPNCGGLVAFKGYGTALKPAAEIIVMAMKPLDGTFANNAEKWGVAGINIDESRVGKQILTWMPRGKSVSYAETTSDHTREGETTVGRWPANIILDEEASQLMDQQSGLTASRFFYCAKASSAERNAGLEGMPEKEKPLMGEFKENPGRSTKKSSPIARANFHPTVKPLKLMEYLLKLVMSPFQDAVVLDPFAGSGSTLVAAKKLGFNAIGIEKEAEYCEIANRRIA